MAKSTDSDAMDATMGFTALAALSEMSTSGLTRRYAKAMSCMLNCDAPSCVASTVMVFSSLSIARHLPSSAAIPHNTDSEHRNSIHMDVRQTEEGKGKSKKKERGRETTGEMRKQMIDRRDMLVTVREEGIAARWGSSPVVKVCDVADSSCPLSVCIVSY